MPGPDNDMNLRALHYRREREAEIVSTHDEAREARHRIADGLLQARVSIQTGEHLSDSGRAKRAGYIDAAIDELRRPAAPVPAPEGRTNRGPVELLADVLQATGVKEAILRPRDGHRLAVCELRDSPEHHGEEEHTNVIAPAETLAEAIQAAVDHYYRADALGAGDVG